MTPDQGFVIDWHPDHHDRVLVVAACSGHGFKHSAAIGEAVAELLTRGATTIDMRPHAFTRFRN
jgi:sarcosine oxidase